MTRREQWVGPPALVEEFGFSPRHWIKMAAAGRVPSARQPFGPRSNWVFDLIAVRAWWDASEKQPQDWRPRPRGVPARGLNRKPQFEPIDLKKTVAKALASHPGKKR